MISSDNSENMSKSEAIKFRLVKLRAEQLRNERETLFEYRQASMRMLLLGLNSEKSEKFL